MDDLTSTTGIVALAAGGLALVALAWAVVLGIKLRRLRRAQLAVIGGEERDLVAHAERLERGFAELRDWVEEALSRLDARVGAAEERIDGCLAYHALVRYDAYGEMSGQQSSSVALLDSRRSGVVVSSILHRDQARVYVKHVNRGESELELSPEEQEALEAALRQPVHG
jgi:hypothetical protein